RAQLAERLGHRIDAYRGRPCDGLLPGEKARSIAGPQMEIPEPVGAPARAAQAQREHALLAGPDSQRERVPAGDELEPVRDVEQQLEPGRSGPGLERELERDLVVLEHALAVELKPG